MSFKKFENRKEKNQMQNNKITKSDLPNINFILNVRLENGIIFV